MPAYRTHLHTSHAPSSFPRASRTKQRPTCTRPSMPWPRGPAGRNGSARASRTTCRHGSSGVLAAITSFRSSPGALVRHWSTCDRITEGRCCPWSARSDREPTLRSGTAKWPPESAPNEGRMARRSTPCRGRSWTSSWRRSASTVCARSPRPTARTTPSSRPPDDRCRHGSRHGFSSWSVRNAVAPQSADQRTPRPSPQAAAAPRNPQRRETAPPDTTGHSESARPTRPGARAAGAFSQ